MNTKNLKRGNPETQFHSGRGNGRGAVENGEKSGRSRREKADLRKAMQDLLSENFKQSDGTEISGANALATVALRQALDPDSKNWSKAFEYVLKLTGMDKAPEEMKMLLARAMLIQAQAETIKKIGDTSSGKLLELLNGLKENNDLHEETAGADASMANEPTETN